MTTELKQLRDTHDAEASSEKACDKSIAELERAHKKCEDNKKKADALAQKAADTHEQHNEQLQTRRAQVEAEMGLGSGRDGEGSKNLQARTCHIIGLRNRAITGLILHVLIAITVLLTGPTLRCIYEGKRT